MGSNPSPATKFITMDGFIMIKEKGTKPRINLNGPEGNAFCLMGYARKWAKSLEYSQEDIEAVISDMMSGDYEHLLSVLETHFGKYVILER